MRADTNPPPKGEPKMDEWDTYEEYEENPYDGTYSEE